MFEVTLEFLSRVLRSVRIERASGKECAIATKLYWPPTPLTTRPSAKPSDTAAPSSVIIMVEFKNLPCRRCAIFNA